MILKKRQSGSLAFVSAKISSKRAIYALVHLPILDCEVGMDRNHGCIERHEFIDISPIFLATNLDKQVKNIDLSLIHI